jgi:CDP-glucose 4,6-dehydratase
LGFGPGALEKVGLTMPVNPEFWRGKRVFLTGHTGFKGSWLTLWLQALGAEVCGFALAPPTQPSLFEVGRVGECMTSAIGDIRNFESVLATLAAFQPQIVIHTAAQALVRQSYIEPVETYATNVMGTVHVLEASRRCASVRCIVNVTSDKCYENREWDWGYRESEPMGGYDPYSNSKGCSELVTSSYRQSFFRDAGIALASARAGNVIGGGDWASDRLVPDILRAFERNEPVVIRNPHSTRPWQHVLEPLSGYLILAERLWHDGQSMAQGWNFGPQEDDARPVSWIVERLVCAWGDGASWRLDQEKHPHEAHYLKLDTSRARNLLGWRPRWNLDTALSNIVLWHRAWHADQDMRQICNEQIEQYMSSIDKESE